MPWQYLPDGRRYRRQANDAIPGLSNQAYKYQSPAQRADPAPLPADRLRRPRAAGAVEAPEGSEGLWDKSLIVVAADHGVAFPKAASAAG